MPLVDAALAYCAAGMSVIATRAEKAPAMSAWKYFETNIASDEQIGSMFMATNAAGVGIVCGAVSGNLECLDFDDGGAAWDDWARAMEEDCPGLLSRLVMEQSPSGGRHLLYRVPDAAIPVGQKLAQRPGEKSPICVIETRGEKQYFCAFPTPGYTMLQGDLCQIPAVTPDEREAMHRLAMAFDRMPAATQPGAGQSRHASDFSAGQSRHASDFSAGHGRPGDDFNHRGDIREALQRNGWTHVRTIGDNEQWRRPGKDKGISATLRNLNGVDIFFVFSTSTSFEAMRGYTPFQAVAILEYGGDFEKAAAELRRRGFGGERAPACPTEGPDDDDWDEPLDDDAAPTDPGPFPAHLLDTPSALRRIQDYILENSIAPQPVFALAAAIAYAGAMLGRRVRTDSGLRTNFFILILGLSGSGKDAPFSTVKNLMSATYPDALGPEDFASDTGLLRALECEPVQLAPFDEFGQFLKALASPRAPAHIKNIQGSLLRLFSNAKSAIYKPKAYARVQDNITLHQPHLVLFGASVPETVYNSLTTESVEDGFLARMLIFEGDDNPVEQRMVETPVPNEIVEIAQKWLKLGDTAPLSTALWKDAPTVRVVEASDAAMDILDAVKKRAKGRASALQGRPHAALWNRAGEHAAKLALVHACAESPTDPYIGEASATWSAELAEWLVARSVFMADGRIADNPFHAKMQKAMRIIRAGGDDGVSRRQLTREMRTSVFDLNQIVDTLEAGGQIKAVEVTRRGTPSIIYQPTKK